MKSIEQFKTENENGELYSFDKVELNRILSKYGSFDLLDAYFSTYLQGLEIPEAENLTPKEIEKRLRQFFYAIKELNPKIEKMIENRTFDYPIFNFNFTLIKLHLETFSSINDKIKYLKYIEKEYKQWFLPLYQNTFLENQFNLILENSNIIIEAFQAWQKLKTFIPKNLNNLKLGITSISFEDKIKLELEYLEDIGKLFCDGSISTEVKSLPENLLRSKPTKKVEVLDGSECSLLLKFMMDKGIFLRPNSELDIGLIGHYLTGYSQDHIRKSISTYYYDNIGRTGEHNKLKRIVKVLEELIEYINSI